MARAAFLPLAVIGLWIGSLHPAAVAAGKDSKGRKDLSESVQEGTVWKGMSHRIEKKAKEKNPLRETSLKINRREGDTFEAQYWITVGANRGSHEQLGLLLAGTINSDGKITASPKKILAGSWQSPHILEERWTGSVVTDAGKLPRIVMHRELPDATVEIGVSRS